MVTEHCYQDDWKRLRNKLNTPFHLILLIELLPCAGHRAGSGDIAVSKAVQVSPGESRCVTVSPQELTQPQGSCTRTYGTDTGRGGAHSVDMCDSVSRPHR